MSGLLNKLTHKNQHNAAHGAPVATVSGTDLNRDGIPDQLQGGRAQPMMGQQGIGMAQPIVHETTTYVAPVVQESIRQDRVVEVQPVVHREIDRNVVHHIEKHIQEAPAPHMGGIVERPAVVQQNVVTNVINEIQPIIHRERVVPVVERTEQHLTERVVEPTIHTHEVIYERAPMPGQQFQQGLAGQQFAGQQQYGRQCVPGQQCITGQNCVAGRPCFPQQGLAGQQGMPMATISGADRNRDGIPDQLQGGQQGFNQGLAGQPLAGQGLHGLGHQPTATISGADRNRDGIPDKLQGGQQGFNQPLAGQQGFNQGLAGQPTAAISGVDRNRDGIPDQLQKPGFQQQPGMQAGGLNQQRF